uniref:Poly(3-hydroxybutyrate) depolymerase n=1 Tax=Euplotes harpa TaxID=151035 RepID=A0A7S3JKQ8_9SPIT|mmetsp:Transcript_4271/g.5176  ORF Transcript_4271/g.5176 Transcript_4271/m.5176 type:complete len:128 (+) Transcript_4271:656-1039(+)
MGSNAYVYVPKACKSSNAKCPLHVVFHGCQQTTADISMQYVENTAYNEVAEDNNLVILYPQAAKAMLVNPNGCWDWWGYTTSSYANKQGPQIKAVNSLISGLKEGSLTLTPMEEDVTTTVESYLKSY